MIQIIKKHWLNIFVGACVMLVLAMDIQAQTLNTVWERSARTGASEALPSWFTVGSVRGMAYGTVDGNERVYAADRANTTIRVMDAATGADVTPTTAFDLSGVGGGTFPMNDVEVSDDGVIFLGNLTTNSSDTSIVNPNPFRLYWWTSEGGAYADSLTLYTPEALRFGDKFTVKGSVADNTAEIWLAASGSASGIVMVGTTTDNGANWSFEKITLSGTNISIPSNSEVAPLEVGRAGDFYIVGNGSSPKRYDSTGAYIANSQFPAANYTGSRNGLKTFKMNGEDHLSVYTYRPDGMDTGNKTGRAIVYNVADATSPVTVVESPLMGDDVDTFSSIHGEAHPKVNMDGTLNIYAMDGVNGFATYTTAMEVDVISISAARDSVDGAIVTVKGIAITPSLESGSRTSFFIQQDGVGINIFDFGTPARIVEVGDSIMVTGEVDSFNNLKEIVVSDVDTDITIINSGNTVPEPRVITYQEFVDAGLLETDTLKIQGSLVRVNGLTTTPGDWPADAGASSSNESATDANDSTYAIRLLAQTEAIGVTPPAGTFDMIAVVGTFNGAQLSPRFASDIVGYFDVTFQADMTGFIDSAAFVPGADFVLLRGSMNGWDASTDTLTDSNEDGIYSITRNLSPGDYNYKFALITGRITGGYENGDNRMLTVSGETTLAPVEPNIDYPDLTEAVFGKVQLFFQVNMEVQILNGNFDPSNNEHSIVVAGGINGWSTTATPLTLGQQEGIYETTVTFDDAAIPQNWAYKFVLNNGETNWESGDDKIISVTEASKQGDTYIAINNTGTPPYFDGITLNDIFAVETEVVFEVDLRPAYYFLADSSKLPNDVQTQGEATSIDFVISNGPLTAGTWETWGEGLADDPDLLLNDDGTDGDAVAGDSVWSFTRTYGAGASKKGAFKFGINGNDNEAGVGADHSLTIDADRLSFIYGAVVRADSVYDDLYDEYILATASGPVVVRRGGSADNGITIPNEIDEIPGKFALEQNYPNPFNPSTNISFNLPVSSQVTLKVYNLLGQEVATLVNGKLGSGLHSVRFDARGLSSGMYLYRIEAGSFVQNKKMMLIK